MNIKELSKEIYDNNVAKGFWKFETCPDCQGYEESQCRTCNLCNGTGKIRLERNVGEMLMLVISELSEALEADRKKRYADLNTYRSIRLNGTYTKNEAFLECIKDSVSDELADVAIRLMDIAYGMELDLDSRVDVLADFTENTAENLLLIAGCLTMSYMAFENDEKDEFQAGVVSAFRQTVKLAEKMGIDLQFHIRAKMDYNATRPFMHNKEY